MALVLRSRLTRRQKSDRQNDGEAHVTNTRHGCHFSLGFSSDAKAEMANTDIITLANPNTAQAPPRKRKRLVERDEDARKLQRPSLFAPFRALGLITNHVPFVLQTRSHKGATDGPRIHILTCLGNSWALWEGGKMNLLFVGAIEAHLPPLILIIYSRNFS
jgi:hypothetical protein